MKKSNIFWLVLLILVVFNIVRIKNLKDTYVTTLEDYKNSSELIKTENLYVNDFKEMEHPFNKPYNKIYKATNFVDLYSLSYQPINIKVGSKLTYKTDASEGLGYLFSYTYPSAILDCTKEELYQARQIAIWYIASKTKEANIKNNELTFDDIINDLGSVSDLVKEKAQKFINAYETLDDERIAKAEIKFEDEDIYWHRNDDYLVIGPFKYTTSNTEKEKNNLKVLDDNDEEIPVVLVDEDDERIELQKNKEFYVLIPNYYDAFKIDLTVTNTKLSPAIYEDDDKNDYLISTYSNEDLHTSKKYTITKSEEDEGSIKSFKL